MAPVDSATVLAERIPGAVLRIYPGGRHGFFEEYGAQVNEIVLTFLESVFRRR